MLAQKVEEHSMSMPDIPLVIVPPTLLYDLFEVLVMSLFSQMSKNMVVALTVVVTHTHLQFANMRMDYRSSSRVFAEAIKHEEAIPGANALQNNNQRMVQVLLSSAIRGRPR